MLKKFVIGLINVYQRYLSFDTGALRAFAPGGACKHSPSCSEYTKQQILGCGVIRGGLRGLSRGLTCF